MSDGLPTEAGLRAAKDEIVSSITGEQARAGLLPRPEQAEAFARPILDKLARDDRDRYARGKDSARNQADVETFDDELGPVTVTRGEALAQATFHRDGTDTVLASADEVAHANTIDSVERPKHNLRRTMRVIAAIELCPRWREPWKSLLFEARTKPLPRGHTGLHCVGCGWDHCKIRDTAVRHIVAESFRALGDPLDNEEDLAILKNAPPAAGSPFGSVDRRYLVPEANQRPGVQAIDFGPARPPGTGWKRG